MILSWPPKSTKSPTVSWSRFSTFLVTVLFFASHSHANESVRTRDLILNGWDIVGKTAETIRKPGMPPYQDAERLIEVTTYQLVKQQKRYTCTIAYERHLDQFDESCVLHK